MVSLNDIDGNELTDDQINRIELIETTRIDSDDTPGYIIKFNNLDAGITSIGYYYDDVTDMQDDLNEIFKLNKFEFNDIEDLGIIIEGSESNKIDTKSDINIGDIIECDYGKFYSAQNVTKVSNYVFKYQITGIEKVPLKWARRKTSSGSEDYYFKVSEIENNTNTEVKYTNISKETYYMVTGKVVEINRACDTINYDNLLLFIDINNKTLHNTRF
jgi:hypothetical protein